jgi:hypothetical protein
MGELYCLFLPYILAFLNCRNIKISLSRYLLMLTLPLVGSLSMASLNVWNIEQGISELNDELKASFGSFIDWDNSVYVISTNNQVGSSIDNFD